MTRISLRSCAAFSLFSIAIACATAEGGDDATAGNTGGSTSLPGDGDGDGDGDVGTTGGAPGTGGIIGMTGGTSPMGGATATGGAATGGAATGGAATGGAAAGGTGGSTPDGACGDYPAISAVSTKGEFGTYTCTMDRDSCSGVTLGEPALFECISDHGPNCTSQAPEGSSGTWAFVSLCSELGMGGASN